MFLCSLYKHIIDQRVTVFLLHAISEKLAVAKSYLQLISSDDLQFKSNEEQGLVSRTDTDINDLFKTPFDLILFNNNVSHYVFSFSFLRTKRYKCMQAAGVFPPCSVQPL